MMDAALWGLIGTVIGAAVSIATTWLGNRSAAQLLRQSNSLEREERARAFQRDNLLSLQDAIQEGMRGVALVVHQDTMAARKGMPWGRSMVSDDVDEGIRLANLRMSALTERIADDALRARIKDFRRKLYLPLEAQSEGEADAGLRGAMKACTDVMGELGSELRRLY